MLTSISPLGERARGNRWTVTVTMYVVASLLGGLTTFITMAYIVFVQPAVLATTAAMATAAPIRSRR